LKANRLYLNEPAQACCDFSSFLQQVFARSIEVVNLRYPNIKDTKVPPAVLRALLFRDLIQLTPAITILIESSVLTNSLRTISKKTSLIPNSNIVSMHVSMININDDRCSDNFYSGVVVSLTRELTESFLERVARHINIGYYLEHFEENHFDSKQQHCFHARHWWTIFHCPQILQSFHGLIHHKTKWFTSVFLKRAHHFTSYFTQAGISATGFSHKFCFIWAW